MVKPQIRKESSYIKNKSRFYHNNSESNREPCDQIGRQPDCFSDCVGTSSLEGSSNIADIGALCTTRHWRAG